MNNFRRYPAPTARPIDTRPAVAMTPSLKTPLPSFASSERKQGLKDAHQRAKDRQKL